MTTSGSDGLLQRHSHQVRWPSWSGLTVLWQFAKADNLCHRTTTHICNIWSVSHGHALMTNGLTLDARGGRQHRHLLAVGTALLVLLACTAQQQPTPSTCVVAHDSGFVGAGGGQEHITVSQNGQPCVMAMDVGRGAIAGGAIAMPATHGVASVRLSNDTSVISYIPAHDYVGSDRFVVDFGPNFRETVDVQVVPSAAKP
jgi:hypothetical protein